MSWLRLNLPISVKLSLLLTVSLFLIFGVFGTIAIKRHNYNLVRGVYENAALVTDIIKQSTRYSMLRNESDNIYQIVNSIASQPEISKIRIYNKDGKITFSTSPVEVNKIVNKQDDACTACHSGTGSPTDLSVFERSRNYYNSDQKHVLGVISPIINDKACSSAACHAHSPDQKVLGVLDVIMYLDKADANLVADERDFAYIFLTVLFSVCLISILFIYSVVHIPLRKILVGTKRVANGDLGFVIDTNTKDEVGALARSFNTMTSDLKDAQEEINQWTKTLEQKVETRSLQLKKTQETMIQSEKMASVGRLAAIVAHEINNPLAGIRTYAKLLIKKISKLIDFEEKNALVSKLQIIDDESARCGDIVKNLLQFAKPSKVELKEVRIVDVVRDSIRLVKHQVDILNIDCNLTFSDPDLLVVCDEQKIKQAMVAVLINACDAIGKNASHGQININVSKLIDKKMICISIQDNGVGMDEAVVINMFEPFFTTKDQGSIHKHNVGLGLSVVYEIIKQHRGEIIVDSKVNMGTTLSMMLPC